MKHGISPTAAALTIIKPPFVKKSYSQYCSIRIKIYGSLFLPFGVTGYAVAMGQINVHNFNKHSTTT